jgi:hypothetical protein
MHPFFFLNFLSLSLKKKIDIKIIHHILGVNPQLFLPKILRADFKTEKKVNLPAKKSIRSCLFKTFYTVARNGDAAQATSRTRIQVLGSSSTVVINVG